MSSEALARIEIIEDALAGLLVEVARLEQERDTASEQHANSLTRGVLAMLDGRAELAEAREREQEAWGTFRRFYDDVDKSQRIDNTGGDSAVAVTLWSWSEMRAALVDEPAAATLAEPGGESVRSTTGSNTSRQEPFQRAPAPSGSASAAADEPAAGTRSFPHDFEGDGKRCLACGDERWLHPTGAWPAADEPRLLVGKHPKRPGDDTVDLAEAVDAAADEPAVSDECPKHGFYKAGYICPECAGAAADEPGETP